MNHIETLIMNEIRKVLENLQRQGVGYIDQEQSKKIIYKIDDKEYHIEVSQWD